MTTTFRHLRSRLLSWLILLRESPGYLPFLPFVARQAFGRRRALPAPAEVPGNLTTAERDWLAALARRTPAEAVIVQSGSPEADATCALAAGCWASRRRIYAVWPEDEAGGETFRQWHRAVIREGLSPYVRPVTGVPPAADLLYHDSTESWPERLKPGAMVVRAASSAAVDGWQRLETCGGLAAWRAAERR
jgi:hypothetical protein